MKTITQIVEEAFPKCSKLKIETQAELLEIMGVMSLLTIKAISERIFDGETNNFVDFVSDLKMFGLDSKTEVRKQIKNNGIKVNNRPPSEKISDIDWIRLGDIEFAVIKKGKNDFDFIFNKFILDY